MSLLSDISQKAPKLCKDFGIRKLVLFGSVASGKESPNSDIDFLADFESPTPDTMPDRYFGFIDSASRLFKRPIQLLTPDMIRNPHLKQSINRNSRIIHE